MRPDFLNNFQLIKFPKKRSRDIVFFRFQAPPGLLEKILTKKKQASPYYLLYFLYFTLKNTFYSISSFSNSSAESLSIYTISFHFHHYPPPFHLVQTNLSLYFSITSIIS